jgi:hypothetical protein
MYANYAKWESYLAHCPIQDIFQCPRHAMARGVSGWPLIALARVQFQASLCGICSNDSGFSLRVFVSPLSVIPTMLHARNLFNRHRR